MRNDRKQTLSRSLRAEGSGQNDSGNGDLVPGGKNDFLTQLFDKARENIEHENDIYKEQKEQYARIMAQAKVVVDAVKDAESANKAIAELHEEGVISELSMKYFGEDLTK